MPNFFLMDPNGYYTEFDAAYEVTQWTEEDGTVTAAYSTDSTINPTHPLCMSVTSTTDGKGVYIDVTAEAGVKYAVEWDYRIMVAQEIDYVIYDQSNGAPISSGTLLPVSNNWYGFYKEVTAPTGCTTIRLYLRAGTATSDVFYIDNVGCRGNLIEFDPEIRASDQSFPFRSTSHAMQDGSEATDITLSRVSWILDFPVLTAARFDKLSRMARSNRVTYFDDGDLPLCVIQGEIYDTFTGTFSGITNPSGTHVAHYDTDSALPSADTDFETTEFSTVNYQAVDEDDSNSVDTSLTVAADIKKYIYHKFEFDVSGSYSLASEIRKIYIQYVGECSDNSGNDINGIVLYVWNGTNWMRVDESASADKTTLVYSTDFPTQAQQFVDIGDQTIRMLARSRGQKGSDGNLTLKSYFASAVVNMDMGTDVDIGQQFLLDATGDVESVTMVDDGTALSLGTDYFIRDGCDRIETTGLSNGDVVQVNFYPRLRVRKSAPLSAKRVNAAAAASPMRSVRLNLTSLDTVTELEA